MTRCSGAVNQANPPIQIAAPTMSVAIQALPSTGKRRTSFGRCQGGVSRSRESGSEMPPPQAGQSRGFVFRSEAEQEEQ